MSTGIELLSIIYSSSTRAALLSNSNQPMSRVLYLNRCKADYITYYFFSTYLQSITKQKRTKE